MNHQINLEIALIADAIEIIKTIYSRKQQVLQLFLPLNLEFPRHCRPERFESSNLSERALRLMENEDLVLLTRSMYHRKRKEISSA